MGELLERPCGAIVGLLLWVGWLVAGPAQAQVQPQPQTLPPAPLTALVQDSASGQSLAFANAALLGRGDSTLASAQADADGRLQLTIPRPGRYTLVVTYVGYGLYRRPLRLAGPADLGVLKLGRSVQQLAEVEVTGTLSPMRQRGDTTEFNAAAFKVNRDASSEDLVGKLPGVTVDGSGVKAMGEQVNQVKVDGKPFFGDDPSQTLRNLPAEMIDKVQLYDERSEASRLTGFDDGNRVRTLNIVTKANRRKGTFGRAQLFGGGAPTAPDRYNANVVANRFDGDRRITVLGQANNINQQNFQISDLAGALGQGRGGMGGGMGRPGGGGMPGGGGGGFGLGNFLVGPQNGINTTTAGGINFSNSYGARKQLEATGSYFVNRTYNVADQATNRAYISRADVSPVLQEDQRNRSLTLNHRAQARLEYKPDTNNTLILRPRLTTQATGTASATRDTTRLGNALLSTLGNDINATQGAVNASNEAVFRHRFARLGRSLVVSTSASLSNQNSQTFRSTLTETYRPGTPAVADSNNQRITTDVQNRTVNVGLTYTEPLAPKVQGLLFYQPDWQARAATRYTYNRVADQEALDLGLTNVLNSRYQTQQAGAGARYGDGKLNLGGQVNYQYATLDVEQNNEADRRRSFRAVLPQFNLQYRPNRENSFSLNLNSATQAPAANQLQTVVNTANLLNLSTGNPDLRQTYTASGNAMYSRNNVALSRAFSVFGFFSVTDDFIANSTFLARRDTVIAGVPLVGGAQLSRPINLGQQVNARSFANYATPLRKLKSNLNLSLTYGYAATPGQVNGATNNAQAHTVGGGLTLASNISEAIDFTLGTNPSYTLVRNTLPTAGNFNYYGQNSRARLNLLIRKAVTFSTSLTHTYLTGLAAGFNQNFLLWGATAGYKFGKAKQWEAQVQATDILRQNQAVSRSVSDIFVQDTRTTVLQRFVMVGLIYTLRKFDNPATNNPEWQMRRRMYENMNPGGGPPPGMMPPPGGGF